MREIHRSPVNSPHKGQWREALMFSLIYARINGWVNNGEAGELRRHRAHCDVIVMLIHIVHLLHTVNRMRYIHVVASDETPPVPYGGMLTSRDYRPCGQFPGIPPTTPTTMVCSEVAIGRYVYAYLAETYHLSICEVEVYGTRKLLIYLWMYKRLCCCTRTIMV